MKGSMDFYAGVGLAHAELLQVTCLRMDNPLGTKDLLLLVQHL